MKNILLLDIDSKMPNLALMKISKWHRNKKDKTFLNKVCDPDKVYISCVFPKNKMKALGITKMFNCNVEVGGSGINLKKELPEEIEHTIPDYNLYDINFSMGFTSRGCIRNCPFCVVPKKEGKIKDHASISEFLHPDHRKLILLDGNFLASPRWYENIEFIKENNLLVNFNQGLDIRLINEENAKALASIKIRNWTFKTDQIHFAFDNIKIEKQVKKGVETLENAGVKRRRLMFYILCGYNSTFEEDMERYKILWEKLNVQPFIMKYNNRNDIPILNHFARWINKMIFKVCKWEDYKPVQKLFGGSNPCESRGK